MKNIYYFSDKMELNKKNLYNLYVTENRTIDEIANYYNLTYHQIRSKLRQNKITKPKELEKEYKLRRGYFKSQTKLTSIGIIKSKIEKEYNYYHLSVKELAKIYNTGVNTIKQSLKVLDVKKTPDALSKTCSKIFNEIDYENVKDYVLNNENITIKDIQNKFKIAECTAYKTIRLLKLSEYVQFNTNNKVEPEDFIAWIKIQKDKPTLSEIASKFGYSEHYASDLVRKFKLSNFVSYGISGPAIKVSEFLDSHNIPYIVNDQRIIKPLELDFVIEDKNLAIEVNDTKTHNSTIIPYECRKPKSQEYHYTKTRLANEAGYQLIHIFEKDIDKLDLVLHSLLPKQVTGASKLKLLGDVNLKNFLGKNHRQGSGSINKGYALVKDNVIYACMTFRKSRNKSNADRELYRYCVKKGWNVKFAAIRLFKNFIKDHPNISIVSYCDLAYNPCNVYEKMGFKYSHTSKPNYKWVKGDQWLSREACQKHKLVNEGYNKNMTEKEIMQSRGYVQVFDCGNKVYIYGG
jgi:hypothetical protein